MRWFMNLTTRSKLILGFGLMIAMLIVVVVVATSSLNAFQADQQRLFTQNYTHTTDIMRVLNNINEQRAALLGMLLDAAPAVVSERTQFIQTNAQTNDTLFQRLRDSAWQDAALRRRLEDLYGIREQYVQARDTEVIPMITGGRRQEAQALTLGVQLDRYRRMQAVGDELSGAMRDETQQTLDRSAQQAAQTLRIFVLVSIFAAGIGVGMTVTMSRAIAGPLNGLAGAAERIAVGDLSVDIPVNHRSDEVGVLAGAFGRMTGSLQQMARWSDQIAAGDLSVQVKPLSEQDMVGNAFVKMVQNLREMTQELAEAVNVLATSANEIMAAASQVASGATETNSAISETTTTIEEVKQTAALSNQKAQSVSDTSQNATEVAQNGRRSVDASIEGMHRIQAQMEALAESIVQLSEQSQAIGEIIATVTDLAEQSNLLSVNAAIEAAKAGEQGKGFAVVAQEVKNLAEQSKEATTQVRSILNEIQRAVSGAVMATEQGGKTVEAGMGRSTEAGEAIRTLTETIERASEAAYQIAASSQQQLAGVDQVAQAMENIKEASGQNVAGARQVEEAARSLNELGQRLKRLMEQFKM